HPTSTLLPYTTLFRSRRRQNPTPRSSSRRAASRGSDPPAGPVDSRGHTHADEAREVGAMQAGDQAVIEEARLRAQVAEQVHVVEDRKSTRLNSSHLVI